LFGPQAIDIETTRKEMKLGMLENNDVIILNDENEKELQSAAIDEYQIQVKKQSQTPATNKVSVSSSTSSNNRLLNIMANIVEISSSDNENTSDTSVSSTSSDDFDC
jgi:putative protein kinase ArgK-like GTPase of G3E family